MAIFELLARVRSLKERALPVSKLAELIVAPEEEGTKVEVGHAVSSAACDVVYHQRFLFFIKNLAQILTQGQILQMTSPIDA